MLEQVPINTDISFLSERQVNPWFIGNSFTSFRSVAATSGEIDINHKIKI